jgi:hypothetical protein
VICDKSYPQKLAFSFLEEIRDEFSQEVKNAFGTQCDDDDYSSKIECIDKPYYFIKFRILLTGVN